MSETAPAAGCAVLRDAAGLQWLTPSWPVPAVVRALSTRRTGGGSEGRYASLNLAAHVGDAVVAVSENRRRLRAGAALPGEPCWLNQVHGTGVVDLDAMPDGGAAHLLPGGTAHLPPVADAAFTRQPGRVCAVLTADCLPLLLAAESGDLVAAVHAGWRGLAAGVIEATVAALPVSAGGLLAWLGPAIGARHFEVGAEVREALLAADPGGAAAFRRNARGRFMADLDLLARRRLAALGVWRVHGGGVCTYAEEAHYFSHRRDGETGRQATLVWLQAPAAR